MCVCVCVCLCVAHLLLIAAKKLVTLSTASSQTEDNPCVWKREAGGRGSNKANASCSTSEHISAFSPFRHACLRKEKTKFKAVLTPILANVDRASSPRPFSRTLHRGRESH